MYNQCFNNLQLYPTTIFLISFLPTIFIIPPQDHPTQLKLNRNKSFNKNIHTHTCIHTYMHSYISIYIHKTKNNEAAGFLNNLKYIHKDNKSGDAIHNTLTKLELSKVTTTTTVPQKKSYVVIFTIPSPFPLPPIFDLGLQSRSVAHDVSRRQVLLVSQRLDGKSTPRRVLLACRKYREGMGRRLGRAVVMCIQVSTKVLVLAIISSSWERE